MSFEPEKVDLIRLPVDFVVRCLVPFLIGARPQIEQRNYEDVAHTLDELIRENWGVRS
jgi:hypothetical protein